MADSRPERAPQPLVDEQILVGTVVGTHGYGGRVRVNPETDNPTRYAQGSVVTIGGQAYTIQRSGPGSGGTVLLVKLTGVDGLEQASELVHQSITVDAADAPELPEGSYYHFQLIGMQVVDTTGGLLGRLTEVIETGSNDVYVVTSESSEIMIPALADVLVVIDVDSNTMTVDIPEGIEPRLLSTPKKRRVGRRRPTQRRPTARTDSPA
jgi:16S rRNA processing protein RimM